MRKYFFLLALAAAALACVWHQQSAGELDAVTITVDGKELYHFSASDLKNDRDIEIQTSRGYNVVHIGGGHVYMKSADCPEQLCVKQGRLMKEGRPIVCLPHRIVISGRGEG